MTRKQRKQARKKVKLTREEIDQLARLIAPHLPPVKKENPAISYFCPNCEIPFCYRTDSRQIFCTDCFLQGACHKNECVLKICDYCKEVK